MDSQGEETCREQKVCRPLLCALHTGWWFSLLADVACWTRVLSPAFRYSFLSSPWQCSVLVCVHQWPPHPVLRRVGPSLTTWVVWFFLLPANKATRFKHEAHTPKKSAGKKKKKNWPKWHILVQNKKPSKALSWYRTLGQGWRGQGDLGTGLSSAFEILGAVCFLVFVFNRVTFS